MKKSVRAARGRDESVDRELLRKARNGDDAAFRRLVRRLEGVVYRYAFKVCRNREKAEEAFQDTFVNMYRKLDQFDGRARLSTWLYTIVTNHCLMKYRKERSRAQHVPLSDLAVTEAVPSHLHRSVRSPLDHVMNKELRDALDSAIGRLPLAYRLVFILRDLEGLSAAETARVLNISVEATKSRLRRARAELRESLDPFVTA